MPNRASSNAPFGRGMPDHIAMARWLIAPNSSEPPAHFEDQKTPEQAICTASAPAENFVKPQSTAAMTLETFDYTSLPTEIQEWLDFTNWHNEEYRQKVLDNHRERLSLRQKLSQLDEDDKELRTLASPTTPVLSLQKKLEHHLPQLTTPDPSVPESTSIPKTCSVTPPPETVNSLKRSASVDKKLDQSPTKIVRTETFPPIATVAQPQTSDNTNACGRETGGSQMWDTSPPRNPRSYNSYKPNRERQHDAPPMHRDRGYGDDERRQGPWERTELRHHPADERPYDSWRPDDAPPRPSGNRAHSPLPHRPRDDDDRSPSHAHRKSSQYMPRTICRYFNDGGCRNGDMCIFLHETTNKR